MLYDLIVLNTFLVSGFPDFFGINTISYLNHTREIPLKDTDRKLLNIGAVPQCSAALDAVGRTDKRSLGGRIAVEISR